MPGGRKALRRAWWSDSNTAAMDCELRKAGTRWLANVKSAPLGGHTFSEKVDRRLDAASAVRDAERAQADFDDGKRAKDHRRVDEAHMGDPERLAREFADPDAKHDAAFFFAVALQRERIMTACHHHGGDRVRALVRLGYIEGKHLAFGPDRNRAAHGFGQQPVAPECVFEAFS